jgi:hypothetical protein
MCSGSPGTGGNNAIKALVSKSIIRSSSSSQSSLENVSRDTATSDIYPKFRKGIPWVGSVLL